MALVRLPRTLAGRLFVTGNQNYEAVASLRSTPDGRQAPPLSLLLTACYGQQPQLDILRVDDLIFSFARNLLERVELRCELELERRDSSDPATEKINQNFPEESKNSQHDAEVAEYNDLAIWMGNQGPIAPTHFLSEPCAPATSFWGLVGVGTRKFGFLGSVDSNAISDTPVRPPCSNSIIISPPTGSVGLTRSDQLASIPGGLVDSINRNFDSS